MPRRNGTGIALLADPTRRRIIAALAIRPGQPSWLADLLDLSRFTVSRQLRILREAGLVVGHPMLLDRRGRRYMLNSNITVRSPHGLPARTWEERSIQLQRRGFPRAVAPPTIRGVSIDWDRVRG